MPDEKNPPLRRAAFVCVAFGLMSTAWFAASGAFTPFSVLLIALMCVHYFALSVVAAHAWCRWKRKDPPELPFVLNRWTGTRAALVVALGTFLVTWGLREGAFAPNLVVNFNMNSFNQDSNWSANSSVSSQHMEEPVVMAGRPTSCLLPQCSPRGPFCDAFIAELSCDNPDDPAANPVMIDLMMSRSGGRGCLTPLLKSTSYSWNAQIGMTGTVPGGTKYVSLDIQGTSSASMRGLGSCYTHQQLSGRDLARVVAGSVRDTLAAN